MRKKEETDKTQTSLYNSVDAKYENAHGQKTSALARREEL
jgi:hypothetical protein